MKTITAQELQAQLEASSDLTLLDVRTPAEFRSGHVPGAVNLPLDQIEKNPQEALKASSGDLVLMCESGKRACLASGHLESTDSPPLTIFKGGMSEWRSQNLPIEGSSNSISIERQVRIAAGTLMLTGILLSLWVHPGFLALSGFVGAGLIFAGITDTCGMGLMLAKARWNR